MKKILVLADSPTIASGFAQVSRNILKDLAATKEYQITVIGIGYDGIGYDHLTYPYTIIPATSGMIPRYNDPYGRQRVLDELATGEYDIFFTIQDLPIIREMIPALKSSKAKHGFKIIMYIPVDSPLDTKPHWVMDVVPFIDYPVAYTLFAKKEIEKFSNHPDIRVCYHGVDTEVFKPLKNLNRVKILNEIFNPTAPFTDEASVDARFKVINVNRNQTRKDYLRTFQIIKEYKEMNPEKNVLLLVVAELKDQGGDLMDIGKQVGLEYGVDWVTPKDYNALNGYPVEFVNMWYNCADVCMSTTLGEGFGLSSIEAMACGVPVIFPRNTSLVEILGDGTRGQLVECGMGTDWLTLGAMDSSLVRPRMYLDDALEALDNVVEGCVSGGTAEALEWAKSKDWREVCKFWVALFKEASES
jgi:glycosyltransferase involved in cell wall biosynthesis